MNTWEIRLAPTPLGKGIAAALARFRAAEEDVQDTGADWQEGAPLGRYHYESVMARYHAAGAELRRLGLEPNLLCQPGLEFSEEEE